MAVADNERCLRYMLLLGEGGQLVVRGILLREVSRRGQTLQAILSNNRHILSSTISNKQQYKHIFPSQTAVNADISTWDICHLGLIVIHLFGKDLSLSEMKDVKEIYEKRIRLEGVASSVSLAEPEYRKLRLQLSMDLLNLASGTDFNTHYECLDIVSASGARPLGLHSMLRQLADLHEFERETLETICSKLEINMKEIEDNSEGDTDFLRHRSGIQRDSLSRKSRGRRSDIRAESWYFGTLTHEETNEIFKNVSKDGIFLVRECLSTPGNFVLCVKEGSRVCQYVISKLHADGNILYRIGEKDFEDLSGLVEFYKTHYLDKTPLTEPAPRQKYLTKYEFEGNDSKDLIFKKGEVLELVSKEDEKWWYARNQDGKIGLVPKLYLTSLKDVKNSENSRADPHKSEENSRDMSPTPPVPKRLPSKALVTKPRISSPYDVSQLTLHEGDIVMVTKIIGDGHCWGECNGKSGLFPSKNVTFLEDL